MTSSLPENPVILVVDPCVETVEDEAYGNLLNILDELRRYVGMERLSFRFWLPARGSFGSVADLFEANRGLRHNLAGCIVLGSYAHVTEEAKYPWIREIDRLIEGEIVSREIPLFAICFAHQWLAHRRGCAVDYMPHPEFAGLHFHNVGLGRMQIISDRFRLLAARVSAEDWNRQTAHAQDYRVALQALRCGELSDDAIRQPLSPAERAAARVLELVPAELEIWTRHWQAVMPFDETRSAGLHVSVSSLLVAVEGLVDARAPVFSLQSHPERPLTPTSRYLLRNFMLMCALGA